MKLSDLIKTLQTIEATHGDVPVCLQSDPDAKPGVITAYESFFVVPEDYPDDGGWCVNMRPWPY